MDYIRDISGFKHALTLSENILNKAYLKEFKTLPVLPVSDITSTSPITLFEIKNFSRADTCLMLDSMKPVLGALHHLNTSIGYILHISAKKMTIYLAIKSHVTEFATVQKLIQNTLKQNNLSGLIELSDEKISKRLLLENLFNSTHTSAISSVIFDETSDILTPHVAAPAIKALVQAMDNETFTLLFLAESAEQTQIKQLTYQLEDLYTLLDSFKQTGFTYNNNLSSNCTKATSESDSATQTLVTAEAKTKTFSKEYDCKNFNTFIANYDADEKFDYAVNIQCIKNNERENSVSASHTETKTQQNTLNCSKSSSDVNINGNSTTYTFNGENKTAKELLIKTDKLLNRLYTSKHLPQFNLGVYFLAPHKYTALRAVFTFLDLLSQNGSPYENNVITWQKDDIAFYPLFNALSQLSHPRFIKSRNSQHFTPTSLISSTNFAHLICMPSFISAH